MQPYEYTVLPAPNRGEKVRGARTGADRFAHALTTEINRMAQAGWEYVRAETLPCEERSGLTSRTTVYHNLLVFRRALAVAAPRPVASAEPPALRAVPHAAAPAQPSADWPDGGAGAQPVAPASASAVDRYDEPGFDPEPGARAASPQADAAPGPASGASSGAEPPAFTRRPPLAARTDQARPVFSGGMPGGRLGPAER